MVYEDVHKSIGNLPHLYTAGEVEGAAAIDSSGHAPGMLSYVRQVFVDELGVEGMEAIARAVLHAPSEFSVVLLQQGGGAVREEDPASCFASRYAPPPYLIYIKISGFVCCVNTGTIPVSTPHSGLRFFLEFLGVWGFRVTPWTERVFSSSLCFF